MAVTHHPAVENCDSISSRRVPVLEKNLLNTGNCQRKVRAVMRTMSDVSMARSVTTVPSDFGKDTPSQRFNIPQRTISPERGMIKLAA